MMTVRILALLLIGGINPTPTLVQSRPAPNIQMPKISAEESFESHFNLKIPKGVRVINYYGETMGMDPSFAWEIGTADRKFLKSLAAKNGLKLATAKNRPNDAGYRWPAWWKKKQIENLPEIYFSDAHNLVRVYVNRKSHRTFIEYVNT